MSLQTSPLPIRKASVVNSASASAIARRKFDFNESSDDELDDRDELVTDRVPCSPYFTQPTQIVTQPTQLVNRTTLQPQPTPVPSSPRSIVEVPRSSPFQQKPPAATGRLASLMAPAGTNFRAPMAAAINKSRKRDFTNISSDNEREILIIDDSSDDDAPARGDILPASRLQVTAKPAAARPATTTTSSHHATKEDEDDEEEEVIAQANLSAPDLMKKGYRMLKELKKMGITRDIDACKRALVLNNKDIDQAVGYIVDKQDSQKKKQQQSTASTSSRDLIRSFAHPGAVISSSSPPPDSPQPKRRRLIQGRRNAAPPSSQQEPKEVVVIESDDSDNEIEEIVENDEADELANSEAHSSDDDIDDDQATARALKYLNSCTVKELVAMLGSKFQARCEELLTHRPFRSAGSVKRVKKAGKQGKATFIGEDIFEAVLEYIKALQAIDKIVAQCEKKGAGLKEVFSSWNVDSKGAKCDDQQPSTPQSTTSSMSSRLIPLPIPEEPKLMRGHCTMKSYQLYGLNWMWQLYQQRFGGILADDMGLGKTCQVVSFISHLIENQESESSSSSGLISPDTGLNLVVVPPSTLANWQVEFKKFAPKIKVTTYAGSQAERAKLGEKIREKPEKHQVILTSYTQMQQESDIIAMRRLKLNITIFDEGHKMKNSETRTYKDLIRITADWRLILTGTPVQNNLMEMINLLNFIQPDLFSRYLEQLNALFRQKVSVRDVSNGALNYSDRVQRARVILEPFILQRKKEQVLSSLPPKTGRVVYCDLRAPLKTIYQQYERQFKSGKDKTEQARVKSSISGTADDQNNIWMQLRKASIHQHLFRREFTDKKVEEMAKILITTVDQSELRQPNIKHLIRELKDSSDMDLHTWCKDYPTISEFDVEVDSWLDSGKVQELLKLIKTYKENGDRVLVFTRFSKVLNILRECLASTGVDHLTLEGATRVSERQELIDDFNNDESITAFLLTTAAGGTGINLTAANKVIIFDQSDNPQDDLQAENRAHRLGQTRPVEVIKLISRGTIEELVYKACQMKMELADRVTGWEEAPEKTAKDVEKQVKEMLLAGVELTPPESSEED